MDFFDDFFDWEDFAMAGALGEELAEEMAEEEIERRKLERELYGGDIEDWDKEL